MLPMILRIRVRSSESAFSLFIPLILVYILLLPAYVITAIVYALMLAAPEQTKEARGYLRIAFHAPQLLTAARGTEVDIESEESDVKLYIR